MDGVLRMNILYPSALKISSIKFVIIVLSLTVCVMLISGQIIQSYKEGKEFVIASLDCSAHNVGSNKH